MDVIIRSTSPQYRRCGLAFTAGGEKFTLTDSESDTPAEYQGEGKDRVLVKGPTIGKRTYAQLEIEAQAGRISVMPADYALAIASPDSALARIKELEGELAKAKARIAELEAKPAPKAGK